MAEFRGFKNQMDGRLASIIPTTVVLAKNKEGIEIPFPHRRFI